MATRSSSSYKKRHTKQRSMPPHLPTPASRQFFSSRRRILMMTIPLALFSAAIFLFFMPFNGSGRSSDSSLDLLSTINEIEVVAEFPHDPNAFTQGLLYAGDDTLFESTGLYGQVICFSLQQSLTLFTRSCLLIIVWFFNYLCNVMLEFDLFCSFSFPLTVFSEESVSPDRKGMVFIL